MTPDELKAYWRARIGYETSDLDFRAELLHKETRAAAVCATLAVVVFLVAIGSLEADAANFRR
jgi:hypothetical protein